MNKNYRSISIRVFKQSIFQKNSVYIYIYKGKGVFNFYCFTVKSIKSQNCFDKIDI